MATPEILPTPIVAASAVQSDWNWEMACLSLVFNTFLFPFYKAGLDGVIIQDLGVLQFVKKHFPGLSLHVSTQMTITGAYGAELLKEEGAERIVPARELSLEEITEMKEKTGLEIETFIHGAMCYCYSGQCLLSSILGGRSGNRGRCAQPCRLPYRVNGSKEQYPLSMKDMCTLAILPELIEAGIDSFKIEGRMKKPEYAAGVTAMYRKYIDLYYNNPDAFCIEEADWNYLKALYIRSDIGEGYYHQHNGKNMITIASPAYLGSDDNLLREIRAAYIEKNLVLLATASAVFKKDMPAVLTLSCGGISVKVEGEVVQKALKQPLSEEKIREQLLKIGNTDFSFESLEITGDVDIFMPVSSLNQLRRAAIEALEEKLIEENGLSYSLRRDVLQKMDMVFEQHKDEKVVKEDRDELHVLVGTKEQLDAALSQKVDRIYLDRQLLTMQVLEELRFLRDKNEIGENIRFYLAFPQIIRYKDEKQLDRLFQLLCEDIIDGVLIRNLESIVYLQKKKNQKPVVTDTNLYIFNKEAVSFMQKYGKEHYIPM